MKKTHIIIISIAIILVGIISCEKASETNNLKLHESKTKVSINWPDVKWKLGISGDLWKPKHNCLRAVGICRINAVFVEFDWTEQQAPINLGVIINDSEPNELIIEFLEGHDISEYTGQDYITVEEGDEVITIDEEVVNYFDEEGIDLSNIELEQGEYYFQFREETENYYLVIPYN